MRLISWNVNGLRAVLKKDFEGYLMDEDADVYCFQEIKALPEQMGDWKPPPGYTALWNPAQRRGYAGTLVLTRIEPDDYSVGIGCETGDAEGRVQTVEFKDYFLVNVYTPNAKGDLSRLDYRTQVWDRRFREHCCALAKNKPVVFCGDLNVAHKEIDLANPRSNRNNAGFTAQERQSFSEHLEAGFIDSFRDFNNEPHKYSWWSYRAGARSRNVGWRLDYFCVSHSYRDRMASAFIRQSVMGSDHCPVGLQLRD